jgi:hypothetical protein
MLGLKSFETAKVVIGGIELAEKIKKGFSRPFGAVKLDEIDMVAAWTQLELLPGRCPRREPWFWRVWTTWKTVSLFALGASGRRSARTA